MRPRGVSVLFAPGVSVYDAAVTVTPDLTEIYNLPAWILRVVTRPRLSSKSNGFGATARICPFEVHLRQVCRGVDEEG